MKFSLLRSFSYSLLHGKVKPITVKAKKEKVDPVKYYEKYGIIYTGNDTSSCFLSLF